MPRLFLISWLPRLAWSRSQLGPVLLAFAVLSWEAHAASLPPLPSACGEWLMADRVNPIDYRKQDPRLGMVERYHFGPNVEALMRPMQKGMALGSDLDYTLAAYPNHHRALAALVRLGQRERTDRPRGSRFTIDCYFTRAVTLAPDDAVSRMLYAQYLGTLGRRDEAMGHLNRVIEQAGENALTHYNAGLLFLELGAFSHAAQQAQRAAELGFARPDLGNELRKRGFLPASHAADGTSSASSSGNAASAPSPDIGRGGSASK